MKRKIAIITFLGVLAIIYLYGMFLSPIPRWLDISYQIVGYVIGVFLLMGLGYWIYSGIVRLTKRKSKKTILR